MKGTRHAYGFWPLGELAHPAAALIDGAHARLPMRIGLGNLTSRLRASLSRHDDDNEDDDENEQETRAAILVQRQLRARWAAYRYFGPDIVHDASGLRASGVIKFLGTMRRARWVKLSAKSTTHRLVLYMTHYWRLPPPTLLISVAGAVDDFPIDARLRLAFENGLHTTTMSTKVHVAAKHKSTRAPCARVYKPYSAVTTCASCKCPLTVYSYFLGSGVDRDQRYGLGSVSSARIVKHKLMPFCCRAPHQIHSLCHNKSTVLRLVCPCSGQNSLVPPSSTGTLSHL